MKKRRNQLILSLVSKKRCWNDEITIDFKWSGVQKEEDIALANFIENYKSKLIRRN